VSTAGPLTDLSTFYALAAIAGACIAIGIRVLRQGIAIPEAAPAPSPRQTWPLGAVISLAVAAGFLALAGLRENPITKFVPPMQATAWYVAASCALSAVIAFLAGLAAHRGRLAGAARTITLILGTAAGTMEAIILAMRVVDAGVELATGSLSFQPASYGFAPAGVVVIALLAFAAAAMSTDEADGRSVSILIWMAAGAAAWAALLAPVLMFSPGGRLIRTSTTFGVMIGLAVVSAGAAILHGLRLRGAGPASPISGLHGHRFATAAINLLLMTTCLYHLAAAVPLDGGFRSAAVVILGCALIGAWSSGTIARQPWSLVHFELAMGLASVGACACFVATAPRYGLTIEERFPLIFVASAVGMAASTVIWTYVAGRIEKGWRPTWADEAMAVDMRKSCKRFAFATAATGALIAALLALWPTRPGIGVSEDTLERFSVGLVAHLLLLWALLYSGRRLRRVTFSMLTLLVLCSTLGFVAIRVLPWARMTG
jgi:hypothetical protein